MILIRLLTLRKALYTFLTSSPAVDAIYRRWRWQAAQQNSQSGRVICSFKESVAEPEPRHFSCRILLLYGIL
jgi:hypothetical protein